MAARYRVADPGLKTTAAMGTNPTTILESVLKVPRAAITPQQLQPTTTKRGTKRKVKAKVKVTIINRRNNFLQPNLTANTLLRT